MQNKRIESILDKAKGIVTENDRIKNLLVQAKDKLEEVMSNGSEKSSFVEKLKVLFRMVKAHVDGSYSAFSMSTILSVVFALVYFITPLDLLPDFIPVIGLSDDISIVLFIYRSLSDDIESFREWEKGMSQ